MRFAVRRARRSRAPAADRERRCCPARATTLVDAVERQMMGDVPVGVFLSGGLDSSLVAAIAAAVLARARRAAADVRGRHARARPTSPPRAQVAEHLGSEHHETTYTAAEALEVAARRRARDRVLRPRPRAQRGAELHARPHHRQHVKVVLTGEGADELFAGYEYLREFTDPDALHAELVRTVRGAAQPQPPALRPRDDGPRPRGARAVPRPRGDRVGAAPARRGEARRAGRPEKQLLREAFDGLAARRPAVARRRPSSATAAARATCSARAVEDDGLRRRVRGRARRGRRRRCARRRSSPTTASSASTSRASAPSSRSAASPAPRAPR